MNKFINCDDIETQQCWADFIDRVGKYISVNCAIPFSVPSANIQEIVRQSLTFFYKNYPDAVEDTYIAIPKEEVLKRGAGGFRRTIDQSTKNTRGVWTLPEGVQAVSGVYEIGGFSGEAGWNSGLLSKQTGDVSMQRMIYQSLYDRSIAVSADNTMYYICTEAFLDLSRQLFQEPITYNYNYLTRKLRFLGDLPKSDVIIECLVQIGDCELFQDDLFFRYVVAQCKIQLSRILASFTYNLPGNISVNSDSIGGDGQSELDAVREEIKSMNVPSFILTN